MSLDLAGLLVSIKADTHSDIDQSLIARLDVLVSRADAKIAKGEVNEVLLDELYESMAELEIKLEEESEQDTSELGVKDAGASSSNVVKHEVGVKDEVVESFVASSSNIVKSEVADKDKVKHSVQDAVLLQELYASDVKAESSDAVSSSDAIMSDLAAAAEEAWYRQVPKTTTDGPSNATTGAAAERRAKRAHGGAKKMKKWKSNKKARRSKNQLARNLLAALIKVLETPPPRPALGPSVPDLPPQRQRSRCTELQCVNRILE